MSQLQVTGEAKIRDLQGPVVSNSGVISALDGAASQYVRGDGTLADFPTSTGGGSSVSYYLNSSVSQGTIGGVAYRQLGKTPIAGAGTDITISANGYVASYITDANDPALLEVPAGNFNCEFYFSVNSNNHNPFVYAEVYKYDGTTFTLIGSSQSVPEYLTNGTTLSPYYFAIPVTQTTLAITDRIAIRIYVNVDGRVVTLHTENNHLCQVVTTFSKGLTSLNNLTRQVQFLATGTSGTDFNIVSSGDTHTFNLPVASATNTGKLSSTDWSTFNNKQPALSFTAPLVNTSNTISIPAATSLVDGYLDNLDWTNFNTAYNNMIVSAAVTGTTTKTLTLTQQDAGTITASWTDDNTDAVTSVFGRTGAVVAVSGDYNTSQVTENTNLYFTDARARAALSAGTGISYNNTTGVITSTITQYTDALARAALSFTAGSGAYNSTTGVITIPTDNNQIANGAGYITSSALSGYLPLTGGTLTGALNINLSSGTAINVAGDAIFRGDTGVGTPRQLTITSGGSTPVYLDAKGYGANYITDFGIRTYNSSGVAFNVFYGTSAGDVGIGNTAPAAKLDVNGTGRFSDNLLISKAAALSILTIKSSSSTTGLWLYLNGLNATLSNQDNGSLAFQTNGTDRLTIASTGAATFASGVTATTFEATDIESGVYANYFGPYSGGSSSILNFLYGSSGSVTWNNGGVKMTLTSGGNVLIGTTTDAGYKLDVNGTGRFSGALSSTRSGVSSQYLEVNGGNSGAVYLSAYGSSKPLVIQNNNTTSSDIYFDQAVASQYIFRQAGTDRLTISSTGAATFSSSVSLTDELIFSGAAVNTSIKTFASNDRDRLRIRAYNEVNLNSDILLTFTTGGAERMRMTSGGNVLIGTTTDTGYMLRVTGYANIGGNLLVNGDTTIGGLAGTGSRAVLADASGNLSAPVSDISVKENINSIGYGLDEILKMNPVWFDFIDEYKNYGQGRQNGNIAQEMEAIIPEAVFVTPSTGKMGINYDQLHAVYIKAIQELKAEIEELKELIKNK
jgi:hypothetical protein